MTLSELGSVGEFVSALAVLATLVYLAIQIRQSSATTRAQIRQSLADSQIQHLNLRATDPFLRGVVGRMFAGETIDDGDGFGLTMHVIAGIRLFENYFAQHHLGTLDPEDWRATREVIKTHFRLPQFRISLALIERSINREFVAELNRIVSEIDRAAAQQSVEPDVE